MRQTLCYSLLIIATMASAQAPAPLIQNVESRATVSLNGAWHAIVDPYDTGYYDYRAKVRGDAFFLNAKPRDKADLVEYDFDRSATLAVPGDWNSQRDPLFFYEGTIWYQRSFIYHPAADKRVFLYVGAANYESRVAVNGKRICDHIGGFTPYNCEITELLRDGQNFVVIWVNNRRDLEAVPTLQTDWWNYGGLTREVMLVEEPKTFIRDYSLQLARGSRDHLTGWIQLDGASAPVKLSVRIPELKLEQEVTTDANGFAKLEVNARGLELWSPESPKLYDVEFASAMDKVSDRIGFRTIEAKGTDILLNGRSIFLRGVDMHEEAAGKPRRAWSEADDRTLLEWAHQLNANFVRLAHYPYNEHMLRLADKMGIMVWAEVPVYWTIDFKNPETLANAQRQLSEMITRDRNRAAVVIWSVGNETPISPPRTKFLATLAKTAHTLDGSRMVSAALQAHSEGEGHRVISDPLGAELDVLGCNEYIGWYEHTPEAADQISWSTPYNKPLIMSEFGAGALLGRHGDSGERWTEEYQANLYEHQLGMLARIPNLRGVSPWVLKDFLSPRRLLAGVQDYWNRKGLVSEDGEKKKAFFVVQRAYRQTEGSDRLKP